MKNYSQNRNTPSRSFYVNELKNTPKNLTKNNDKLDFLENKLENFLTYSFNFFHPFFNDDEYEENKNHFKSEPNVDNEFDQTIEKHSPAWLLFVFSFFKILYNKFIGIKTIHNIISKVRKTTNIFNNTLLNKQFLKTRKFFAFKSPP